MINQSMMLIIKGMSFINIFDGFSPSFLMCIKYKYRNIPYITNGVVYIRFSVWKVLIAFSETVYNA